MIHAPVSFVAISVLRRVGSALLVLCVSGLGACSMHSPYSGMTGRDIKALSTGDIEGLKSGRGMGMALAAELNGYPGPMHVLELRDQLALTNDQILASTALFEQMRTLAIGHGASLIAAERELDALFVSGAATPESLKAALERVAAAQAQVRGAHLLAHLEQVRILSRDQVTQYNRLRGYRM